MRATFAEINLSNLRYNYLNIRKKINNAKVMAVVKADAYGHGMIQCVKSLSNLGMKRPEYYGVALLEEGIELRKSKIMKDPIVTFSPFTSADMDDYLNYQIFPTLSDKAHIIYISRYRGRKKLRIHINIDTGMGRLGLHYSSAVEDIKRISRIKSVIIDGIYTHFATSDHKDKSFANLQFERFRSVLDRLREDNICCGIIHAANSGAILDMPQAVFDMVRPGISLYGYYPSLETSESIPLKPVMSLISKVSSIKSISKGESVSYGRKFIAGKNTRIASVSIGYADGYVRSLTNNAKSIIRRSYYPQVGTVTMDRIMFNIGNDKISTGDKVILLGRQNKLEINAWHWSKILNTIPYEITCNISKRVPRIYIGK